jgi:hypothetical protein
MDRLAPHKFSFSGAIVHSWFISRRKSSEMSSLFVHQSIQEMKDVISDGMKGR